MGMSVYSTLSYGIEIATEAMDAALETYNEANVDEVGADEFTEVLDQLAPPNIFVESMCGAYGETYTWALVVSGVGTGGGWEGVTTVDMKGLQAQVTPAIDELLKATMIQLRLATDADAEPAWLLGTSLG